MAKINLGLQLVIILTKHKYNMQEYIMVTEDKVELIIIR